MLVIPELPQRLPLTLLYHPSIKLLICIQRSVLKVYIDIVDFPLSLPYQTDLHFPLFFQFTTTFCHSPTASLAALSLLSLSLSLCVSEFLMMATALRTPTFRPPLPPIFSRSPKSFCVSLRHSSGFGTFSLTSLRLANIASLRFAKFVPFAFDGETKATEAQAVQEPEVQDSSDDVVGVEDSTGDNEVTDAEETPASPLLTLFQSYKEAIANNDETKLAELESSLKSIEDEKNGLEGKVTSLSEELSIAKERIMRISADFDNFRKRTERERLSLVTNAQGEVVESLLPVLDNFERAKAQIKVETEGEEKINNSYQSIYKQFIEILSSLGVEPVETIGKPFDPLLHEAIMREDSTEFEEGIVIGEFRKGFKLGDRLLRPSMVKVSAGPGPAKPEEEGPQEQDTSEISESSKENQGSAEPGSA